MPEKYRPSNGTEGACFHEAWCCKCARDKAMSDGMPIDDCDHDEKCQIIADTFAFDVDDPRYPKEWTYDAAGVPVCTAFIPVGEPIPKPRCTRTLDMFAESERGEGG